MRIDKIPETAVLIEGTIDDYVDAQGNVYGYNHRANQECYPYIKEQYETWGYKYAPVNYISGKKNRRVHRLVAEAFIPNPHNFPIVMHKDNNKKNNQINNLKWGTISENTKQAFDDGLAYNAKGEDDSQSIPCDMYETATNKFIKAFGSCKEAARFTGISASTICRQVKNPEKTIRKTYYFTKRNEGMRDHDIVVAFDFFTDTIVGQYANCQKAADALEVSSKLVNTQILKNRKPHYINSRYYFKRMYLKGEEIIEIPAESRVDCA